MQKSVNGPLDPDFFGQYDKFVQEVLKNGGKPIIDVHNYARYHGKVVGQSEVTDDNFVDLWSKIATKYANSPEVIFGIVNEPHALDMDKWGKTVQKVVNGIRKAGAKSNIILLPGDHYTAMGDFPNWLKYLKDVKNPDGTNENLMFDLHTYFDGDGSGQNSECKQDRLDVVQKVQQTLSQANRKAIITEVGAGNNEGCAKIMQNFLTAVTNSPDQFYGFTIWAAGAFSPDSPVQVTPRGTTDSLLWEKGIKMFLTGGSGTDGPKPNKAGPASSSAAASASSSAAGSESTAAASASSSAAGSASSTSASVAAADTTPTASASASDSGSSATPTASASASDSGSSASPSTTADSSSSVSPTPTASADSSAKSGPEASVEEDLTMFTAALDKWKGVLSRASPKVRRRK